MMLTLDSIRNCLEGAIPTAVATCDADGVPNVTYVSQVHYVDASHVALSFQFFNKTRENILANPHASALVIDPGTAAQYQIDLRYMRTETSGPVFESMKAKLAGIASHTGMSGVFKLRGSDFYRVLRISALPHDPLPTKSPRRQLLAALRACAGKLSAPDLDTLLSSVLTSLETDFQIRHSMVLMLDCAGKKLYTVDRKSVV